MSQFFAAVRARVDPPDDSPAREGLPPNLYSLFGEMQPEDQGHGLQVLRILESSGPVEEVVRQAALLHDVGKANAGIGLAHRILRVLVARRLPAVWAWLAGWPTGWHRPFWVVANHPERGAVWVESVGGSPELVELIRYHESDAPEEWSGTPLLRWHSALAGADALC